MLELLTLAGASTGVVVLFGGVTIAFIAILALTPPYKGTRVITSKIGDSYICRMIDKR